MQSESIDLWKLSIRNDGYQSASSDAASSDAASTGTAVAQYALQLKARTLEAAAHPVLMAIILIIFTLCLAATTFTMIMLQRAEALQVCTVAL